MPDKLSIYILGDYKPGAPDGLTEFSYQNYLLLKDVFFFQFVEFDDHRNTDYYELETREGVLIHRFGSKNLMSLQLPDLLKKWINNLPKENTVFHLSHIYNLPNYLVARLLKKAQIPYLITPHDSYVYGKPYKSKNMSFLKRCYRDLFVSVFDKFVLDNASVVHALTSQCTESLITLTSSKIKTVGNQVHEVGSEFTLDKIKRYVSFIGRFHITQKGIDLALKAFKVFKLRNEHHKDVSFTLIGPANAKETSDYKRICRELDLQIGVDVNFTGRILENERNKLLSESSVYIQLSRSEGFGLSIVQALSCFKPVIISRQTPINDKIIKHKAGYVVDNEVEAAKALEEIFSLSAHEYEELAMNARACYMEEFHPEVIKPQLMELYKEAAKIK